MKIGVVSDTHGCLETWRKIFSQYFSDADLILHAGDILYHGPRNPIPAEYNPKELAEELNNCPVPILVACGNCDAEVDTLVLNFPIQSPYTYLMADGLRIVITHGHNLDDNTRLSMAKSFKADIFITGHIHLPVLEEIDGTIFLNPGSPGMSKREDSHGTIALIENGGIDILDIVTGQKLFSKTISQ